jgi:ribose transport system permease protein
MTDLETVTPPPPDRAERLQTVGRWARRGGLVGMIRGHGILLALLILVAAGALLSPNFMTLSNFANVARQGSIVAILGIGMTFVILTAGIDLSVGSIMGLVAISFASLLSIGLLWPLAIAGAMLIGAGVGAINGLGIVKGGLQPFIMTLGMLVIARGVTMTLADGRPVRAGAGAEGIAWIGNGTVLGLPVPLLIFIGIALTSWFVLKATPFGRQIYAVGDNLEAARLSGIPTGRVIFSAYVISGLCAAAAALIVVSRLAAAETTQGQGNELDAIAIVVIGGTSLFGGEGGVAGTVIGAAVVAAMNNLLNLLGVSPFSQQIVKGLIILGAVLLERRTRAREEGR